MQDGRAARPLPVHDGVALHCYLQALASVAPTGEDGGKSGEGRFELVSLYGFSAGMGEGRVLGGGW